MSRRPTYLKYLDYLPVWKKTKLRYGSDCSGIEAPLQALNALNIDYEHVFSSEIDANARDLLFLNYGKPLFFSDDITKRDHSKLPHVDLYVAGFPCQAFSHMGKRGGFYDYKGRGIIFFECYDTIIATNPNMFILENVKGLLTHNNGNTINIIRSYLDQLNYDIYIDLLNSKDYGVPQNRERVFIVGLKRGMFRKFRFPSKIKLEVYIDDIIYESGRLPQLKLTEHKKEILRDLRKNNIITDFNEPWVVNLNCSSYKRSSPMFNISPCLMSSGAVYYVPSVKRNLTPDEFLQLQGFIHFDKGTQHSGIYKVAGNSMSVPVIAFIINNMLSSRK